MDVQTMINTMLMLIAFLGGWTMHSFRSQIRDNRNDIKETKDRLHEIELTVAGKYVTRDELAEHSAVVMKKLDEIQSDIRSCMLQKRRKDDTHEC